MNKNFISPIITLLTVNSLCAFYIAPLFATPYVESEFNESTQDKEQATFDITVTSKSSNLLKNDEPLPINARILSLLDLLKEEPKNNVIEVERILPQIKAIDETFKLRTELT